MTVNGQAATLGDKADMDTDSLEVDGLAIEKKGAHTYLMLYKPRGYVTTLSDEKGRKSVADLVKDCGARVWPVGRLDLDSEGLLLLTDDGDLTNKLTHPRNDVEKEYYTMVSGDFLAAYPILTEDMTIDGEKMRGAKISFLREEGERTMLSITISEGKNRQVRRMCAHAGLQVHRLKRVREGDLWLDRKLRSGQYRTLTKNELAELSKGHVEEV